MTTETTQARVEGTLDPLLAPQCSPPNEPMPDDPRDIQIHELFRRVIDLEAQVNDLRRWRRRDYDKPVEFVQANNVLSVSGKQKGTNAKHRTTA